MEGELMVTRFCEQGNCKVRHRDREPGTRRVTLQENNLGAQGERASETEGKRD